MNLNHFAVPAVREMIQLRSSSTTSREPPNDFAFWHVHDTIIGTDVFKQ